MNSDMYNYGNVKRWTAHPPSINVFELDMVLVPINSANVRDSIDACSLHTKLLKTSQRCHCTPHLLTQRQSHWSLAVMYMAQKRICHYDSSSFHSGSAIKGRLLRWVQLIAMLVAALCVSMSKLLCMCSCVCLCMWLWLWLWLCLCLCL